jgi:hypothetical protein
MFNVTFKKAGAAARAVERFHGTSIDNGAKTMSVSFVGC